MKKTVKIAFCGMMSALGAVLLLLAYFPYFTYAVPALAGFIILAVYVETSARWSLATYAVTAVLALIFAEPEAKLMYIFLFGYYPVLKIYIEKIKMRPLQYLIKLLVFNASLFAVYGIFAGIAGISLDIGGNYGIYGVIGITVLANITFLLYDIVLVRVAGFYMQRLHPQVKKLFK